MFYKCLLLLSAACCGAAPVLAETIQLKEKAAVTGRIVSEKRDHVAVDLGFTVLVIPRNQIARIVQTDVPGGKPGKSGAKAIAPEPVTLTEAATGATATSSLYKTSAKSQPSRTVRELVNELGEAVVQVRTPSGLGSGFFINEDGFLITNFHVIEGETQISIEVYHEQDGQIDRRSYKQVRIVAMNKFEDLALLKIEENELPKFKHVNLGSTRDLAVGERVFAIGSPLGLERTVTEGILSTKTRQMQGELYLQTTTQINPGNSGGPLFNLSGEVVGVTSMKITFGEGLGFAIPIEAVRFFLDHRDSYAYSNDNPSNGYRYLEPPSKTRFTAAE